MKQIRLSEVFTPTFQKVWALVKEQRYLRYVLKGGRASAKSTHIAMMLLLLIMRFPVTALVVRRVGNTLADSVLEQLKEAMEILGVTEYFQITVNPMRITYLPRGNRILFRGADDPQKIKSIKASKFPLAIMWIEELAEFKTEEEVSVIEKSVLRGELSDGLRYTFFYSYNPPKRKQSWVNQKYETQFLPENTFVHHSTYLDNPFLSQDFIEEAEHTKRTNEMKYRHEYLGEPIGSGEALRYRYSDLNMDCNILETEFQSSLEQLIWFIDQYLLMTGKGDFTNEPISIIFNRDVMINESEVIANCQASVGILDDQTICENHPWYTEQVEEQLKKQQEQEQMPNGYQGVFRQRKKAGNVNE